MINLYIFNEKSSAAVFGIGTYIRELIVALKGSNINVCVIHLRSEKPDMEMEEIDGIRYWYIPSPSTINNNYQKTEELNDRYYRNISYLLQLYIVQKEYGENIIFYMNYLKCKPLVDALKTTFDCKIVLVVHYLNSIMTLMGNISQLRSIISQTDELTDKIEKFAKEAFLNEQKLFQSHSIDKIICLSYHAFDLLHQDYQIDKEKMVVIYNGLTDVTVR